MVKKLYKYYNGINNALFIAIFLFLPYSLIGQINFFNYYSSSGYDKGQGVVQLKDSSYVICGASSSFSNSPSQAFLMKVDSLGNHIWSNHYGGNESELGRRVLHKENFGFFVTGYSNSFGSNAYDFYLVKTDENGVKEWEKTYGSSGWDKVNDAVMLRDTGVVMVGESSTGTELGIDMFIVRTNKFGDTLWTKTIGGVGLDNATSVQLYHDSVLLIAGHKWVEDSLCTKAFMMYMDEDGTIIDEAFLNNSPGEWRLTDITLKNDTIQGIGHFRDTVGIHWSLARYSFSVQPGSISSNWNYTQPPGGNWYGVNIAHYGDSSSVYLSYVHNDHAFSFPHGVSLSVSRYTWDLVWISSFQEIAKDYDDMSGEIIRTSDGGAAVVGYRENIVFGAGGGTVFLDKIGKNETYPTFIGLRTFTSLVSIDEIHSTIKALIYPNPTSSAFTIQLNNENTHEVRLLNAIGQEVYRESICGTKTIDVSSFSAGFYTVNIKDDTNNTGTYRLIIR